MCCGSVFCFKIGCIFYNRCFLGLIAGSLIDMNLRSIYKNKSVKISGYLEHKQRIVEKETSM